MTPPKNTTRNRVWRTTLQLVAGGALTEVADELIRLAPGAKAFVALGLAWVVSCAQNLLEDQGRIKDRRS